MNVLEPAQTGGSSSVMDNTNAFSSKEGLLRLLVAIRGSSMPAELKTALRDAVLDHSQQTDAAKQQQIQADITAALEPYASEFAALTLGVAPTSADAVAPTPEPQLEEAPVAVKPPTLGRTRLTPIFTPSTAASKVAIPTPKSDASAPTPASVATEKEVSKTEKNQPAPAVLTADAASEAASTPVKLNIDPSPSVAAPSLEKHLERIRTIKRSVNERVGNPINLIDTNNEIGREYMNALLEAMKRVSGDSAGADTAMSRLEVAYQQVEKLLSNPITVPETAQKGAPSTTTTVETKAVSTPVPTQEPIATQTQSVMPAVGTTENVPPVSKPATEVVAPSNQNVAAENAESVAPAQPVSKPAPVADKPVPQTPAGNKQFWSDLAAKTLDPDVIAEERRKADPKNMDVTKADVEAGLQQLLSEWKLFKSSGIFGTGPSGTEHPLYKILAQLPMAAVIAGRFEGSSPEVKQSITDYMNGWRYEQGIIHELNETFEQYLTRVIAHILKRQKEQKQA
ncbi:hypothetical protein KC722_00330 [Candidatus Kaiserbacteria bacterium]|nr:hypothetical protein [Candidatus Kaiserbacteria bacterium]MCB9811958.1 hypothetical protein [Candidatus Nomurabacteria bacterium]